MQHKEPNSKVVTVFAKELEVHPSAQRGLLPTRLQHLRKNLDLDAIGVMHGVDYPINGVRKVWIIDGQHRLMALIKEDLGDWPVEVKIHLDCQTDARAAELFLLLNDRAKVSAYDNFVNEMKAQKAEAIIINRIVHEAGLSISKTKGDHRLNCINALRRIYQLDQGRALTMTLEVIRQAWGTKQAGLEGKLVDGMGIVIGRYRTTIDQENFVGKLAAYPGGAAAIMGDAKGRAGFMKRPLVNSVADIIVETYNKGRRSGHLAPLESVVEA